MACYVIKPPSLFRGQLCEDRSAKPGVRLICPLSLHIMLQREEDWVEKEDWVEEEDRVEEVEQMA